MATARKVSSTRLQAVRAEAIAEQAQPPVKPLSSYFGGPEKGSRRPRAASKPNG